MLLNNVPIHKLSEEKVKELKDQLLSGYSSAQLPEKILSLETTVKELKTENAEFKERPKVSSTATNDVLLNQQQLLAQIM